VVGVLLLGTGVLQASPVRQSADGRRIDCVIHQLERAAAVKHEADEVSCVLLTLLLS